MPSAIGHSPRSPESWRPFSLTIRARDRGEPVAVLSDRSAAWLWGFVREPADPVELTLIGCDRRSGDGIRLRRVRRLDPADRTTRRGIPVTTPARTLLDLASVLDARELRRAFEEALVQRLVTKTALRATLERSPGRGGTRILRALLDQDDGPHLTRLEAEKRFRELMREAGLPLPRTNVGVAGYEVDAHWARERLVVEIDSWTFHRTRASFERDRRKDAELGVAGYRVMRVTWRQIVDEPAALAVRIGQALAAKT